MDVKLGIHMLYVHTNRFIWIFYIEVAQLTDVKNLRKVEESMTST